MKRVAVTLLALLAVDTAADSRKPSRGISLPRGCRDRGCVRERTVGDTAAPVVKNIGNAITAGDRSGNWWQLNTDGTTQAGSSLAMASAGSPPVSPLGFNGVDQKWTSSTTPAFPTGSFSVVVAFNIDSGFGGPGEVISKWEGGNLVYTLELASGTTPNFYVIGASVSTGRAIGDALTQGIWVCLAGTYTTGTGELVLRTYGGANAGATASGGGVLSNSSAHRVGAYSGGGFFKGLSRGAFFTEKVLSDSDIDRICAGAL